MTKREFKTEKCPHCGCYSNRPLAIDAVIIRNKKILLIRRGNAPCKDLWALPGGHVDWNETVDETVVREVMEETGLSVKKFKLIGVYSNIKRHPLQAVAVAFFVSVKRGKEKAGSDAGKIMWFDLGSLPEELAFDHHEIIADAVKSISAV